MRKKLLTALISLTLSIGFNIELARAYETNEISQADYIQKLSDNTNINWSKQTIMVTGSGAPPEKGSVAQKRLMAMRAARVDAFRKLAETINGVHVNSETIVKDFVTESDIIKTQVEALIKGAEQIGEPRYISDGAVEIDMRVNLFGENSVASILKPEEQTDNIPATTLEPINVTESYTSVIIDCKGLGVQPAMSPTIIDENGGEIYYGDLPVDPEFVINEGIVSYASSITNAKKNDRVGGNPLIIKGKKVLGLFKSDVVISNDDAKKLIGANNKSSFLNISKVIMSL